MIKSKNKLAEDLDAILKQGTALWPMLKDARVFITGGTGFIGTWLLESIVWLNENLDLNMQAVVLTRNVDAFVKKAPHIAIHNGITLFKGDVRNFVFPEGKFSFVIHGATDASAKLNAENPIHMFDTIVEGTRRTLDFAVHSGAKNFLFLSSGAIYGEQPTQIEYVSELDYIGPNCSNADSAYAEGKRAAELLCTLYVKQHGIQTKLARCFAFVGPYLPLDTHFAIGNFIRDAMAGSTININGDGTPYRSYLYASDLILWLWTILLIGKSSTPYNVGSNEAISISELAELVDRTLSGHGINIREQARAGFPAKRYVPSVNRAEIELGLTREVVLEQAIYKTARWYGWKQF